MSAPLVGSPSTFPSFLKRFIFTCIYITGRSPQFQRFWNDVLFGEVSCELGSGCEQLFESHVKGLLSRNCHMVYSHVHAATRGWLQPVAMGQRHSTDGRVSWVDIFCDAALRDELLAFLDVQPWEVPFESGAKFFSARVSSARCKSPGTVRELPFSRFVCLSQKVVIAGAGDWRYAAQRGAGISASQL